MPTSSAAHSTTCACFGQRTNCALPKQRMLISIQLTCADNSSAVHASQTDNSFQVYLHNKWKVPFILCLEEHCQVECTQSQHVCSYPQHVRLPLNTIPSITVNNRDIYIGKFLSSARQHVSSVLLTLYGQKRKDYS
jgi:hypothetical protein